MEEALIEKLRQADQLLVRRKQTVSFYESASLSGGTLFAQAVAGEGFLKIKSAGSRLLSPPGKLLRRYGRTSKEGAAAGALAVRDQAGSNWGVFITAPALLPVPLTGDPREDGGTDVAAIFIAVSDGRKAAVQQLDCPGDLSDRTARREAAESAAQQAVNLLIGLLEEEPSAVSLRFSATGLRKYACPLWKRLWRVVFPWKGDSIGMWVLKLALVAAAMAVVIAAGLWVSDAAGYREIPQETGAGNSAYLAPGDGPGLSVTDERWTQG